MSLEKTVSKLYRKIGNNCKGQERAVVYVALSDLMECLLEQTEEHFRNMHIVGLLHRLLSYPLFNGIEQPEVFGVDDLAELPDEQSRNGVILSRVKSLVDRSTPLAESMRAIGDPALLRDPSDF